MMSYKSLSSGSGRVLITGGMGRLGRVLTDYLQTKGYEVHAFVRSDSEPSTQNVRSTEAALVEQLQSTDVVLHLASTASSDRAVQEAVHIDLTQGLLDAMAVAPPKHFVYFSSAKALAGEHSTEQLSVDAHPQPTSHYGRFKLAAEQLIRGHPVMGSTACVTETTILRLPMVYGPGCAGNFDRLANLIRRGVPVPLARDNVRSLLFTENLCAYIGDLLAGSLLESPSRLPPQERLETEGRGTRIVHLADSNPPPSAMLAQWMANSQHLSLIHI